jgi:hypothetical protein
MPKETPGRHTRASLEETARQIRGILADVRAIIELMDSPPVPVDEVTIQREVSREKGIRFLRSWADSARDAVDQARDDKSRKTKARKAERAEKTDVSEKPDTVSERHQKSRKTLSPDSEEEVCMKAIGHTVPSPQPIAM